MNRLSTQKKDAAQVAEPGRWIDRNRDVVSLGLAWLRVLLEAYIHRMRTSAPAGTFLSANGVVSDLKADWLLRELAQPGFAHGPGGEIGAARRGYDTARIAMRESGEPAAIDQLSNTLGLAPFDEDVLLLALAPGVDAAFQALYGYAHDRVSLGFATPHLVQQLILPAPSDRADARSRLGPDAPLRRFALLAVEEGASDALAALHVDERIAGYLLGEGDIDPRVRACLRHVTPGKCPTRHRKALEKLAVELEAQARPAVLIVGPPRCGRRAAAAMLAAHFGLVLLELETSTLPQDTRGRRARFPLIAREAALARFAIVLDVQSALGDEQNAGRLAIQLAEDALEGLDAFLILIAQEQIALRNRPPAMQLVALDAADRAAIWRESPGAENIPDVAIDAVAEQFTLGPSQIAEIAAQQSKPGGRGLWSACREAASCGVATLAERIVPRFGWDDIVLPESVRNDLEALVGQIRHRTRVYRQWGFARRLPRGRGVSALFAGPSGVGKTMAAEVIAHELDLDLYRIDLSGVVSKYIGETEKNLRRVFDAAEAAGAVLFFDEADALFGKRSEVKDSHDRYANIEVSYLLQRMEAYSGLAVLATNLKTHLDDAFLRRLRYVIDIPFPDAALRRGIWGKAIPPQAPTEGIDLDALARLDIAGGNITVIAVNAAFLAAAEDAPIRMEHIARAARSEYHKLDKEFRPLWAEAR